MHASRPGDLVPLRVSVELDTREALRESATNNLLRQQQTRRESRVRRVVPALQQMANPSLFERIVDRNREPTKAKDKEPKRSGPYGPASHIRVEGDSVALRRHRRATPSLPTGRLDAKRFAELTVECIALMVGPPNLERDRTERRQVAAFAPDIAQQFSAEPGLIAVPIALHIKIRRALEGTDEHAVAGLGRRLPKSHHCEPVGIDRPERYTSRMIRENVISKRDRSRSIVGSHTKVRRVIVRRRHQVAVRVDQGEERDHPLVAPDCVDVQRAGPAKGAPPCFEPGGAAVGTGCRRGCEFLPLFGRRPPTGGPTTGTTLTV